jgi:hypothetical protein
MPIAVQTRSQTLEYSTLNGAKPAGAKIGFFAGEPIFDSVIDGHGRRFTYVGAAVRGADGQLNPETLRKGEFILLPGLVYRFAGSR